ncbi:MAG TPA: succinate dehydrogenase [Candidatus Limnocylindria bacterium]|nr:succinate dehydrogenase [Candidatus Limnocylindria bacterium]
MATTTASVRQRPHERHDRWWIEPLFIVLVLGGFGLYAFVVSIQNAYYYFDPYLSPFYSPCLTTGCVHPTFAVIGDWYNLSPAFLIVGSPLAFRATCYYYRRSYYRAFFGSPPACTVPDVRAKYSGETRLPFVLQNIHRYTLYLAIPVLAILWWDVLQAFRFPVPHPEQFSVVTTEWRFGVGVGTLIMLANVVLLSGYTFGCHAARYLVGGYLDSFHGASLRFRLWSWANRLNAFHSRWAWFSLFSVMLTDLYIRLAAMGVINDLRWVP